MAQFPFRTQHLRRIARLNFDRDLVRQYASSTDDLDVNSQHGPEPRPIAGECRALLTFSERQACSIGERQAEMARQAAQFTDAVCKACVKVDDSDSKTKNMLSRLVPVGAALNQFRHYLSVVDRRN
jgi:hypothetical protein